MAQIRHLISAEEVAELLKVKPRLGDPMKMNKTRFVEYMEHQADYIYELYRENGHDHDSALALATAKLVDMNKEWKQAAKLKAQSR